MNICLLTRRPELDSGGIGRVSISIRDGLMNNGNNVKTVSANNVDLVGYFKYTFIDNFFKMPRGYDVYHAITPMESIWVPKDISVATILDIIPITHPELHGARMSGNKVKYTIGKLCFNIGCIQASKCRYVVCISEHVKQEFINYFDVDEKKVSVIKLGIRDDLTSSPKKDNTFRFGYLGQIDRRKRTDLLVRSFKQSNIDAELVLVGRGIDEPIIKELVEDDERIKYLGFIPDNEIVDFYNSLDVFVFPTSIEGYGLPPVEAMACKKPVVVLDDAIIPKDVKNRCISVENLAEMFNNPTYLDVLMHMVDIDDNYLWAKSHDWGSTIEEYSKLYRRIIG